MRFVSYDNSNYLCQSNNDNDDDDYDYDGDEEIFQGPEVKRYEDDVEDYEDNLGCTYTEVVDNPYWQPRMIADRCRQHPIDYNDENKRILERIIEA